MVLDAESELLNGTSVSKPGIEDIPNSRTGTLLSETKENELEKNNSTNKKNNKKNSWTLAEVVQEFKPSIMIAWPIILANTLQFIVPVISLSFVGQLGEMELAGVGLGMAFSNIAGMSIVIGSSIACDSLCSQAYGAKNFARIGVLVQRGSLFIGTLLLPIAGLWINANNLLLLLGQDPEAARLSQVFLVHYIPALVFSAAYVMLTKLITCQGIVLPLVFSCAGASTVNIVANYLLINKGGLGVKGGAIAADIASFTMFITLLMIIKWKKYDKLVWQGWSQECLDKWGQYASMAVPSLFSLATEWGTYEVGAFIVGLISKTDVGVHSIMMSVVGTIFQIPYGLEMAICIRVAHFMGSGNVRRAKMVLRACLMIQVLCGITVSIAVFFLRFELGKIFTSDSGVLKLAASTFQITAISLFFDGMQALASGGIKGLGLLKYAFITNFISYDILALPIAISLTLATNLHVKGYWIGLATAGVFQFSIYVGFLLSINWSFHSKKARKRAGVAISLLSIRSNTLTEATGNSVAEGRRISRESRSMLDHEQQEDATIDLNTHSDGSPDAFVAFTGLNTHTIAYRIIFVVCSVLLLVTGILLSILL